MIFPNAVQTVISTYKIGGIIPLDKTLHFTVGMLVTIILRIKKIHIKKIFIFLASIEFIKEIHDSFTLNSSFFEEFLDMFWTLAYPLLLLIVIKSKKKLNSKLTKETNQK